jgi:hypothetical protein
LRFWIVDWHKRVDKAREVRHHAVPEIDNDSAILPDIVVIVSVAPSVIHKRTVRPLIHMDGIDAQQIRLEGAPEN